MKKQKYAVYRLDELNYGSQGVSRNKTYLGRVSATSPKQAINDTKTVLGIKSDNLFCSYSMNGYRASSIVAERI